MLSRQSGRHTARPEVRAIREDRQAARASLSVVAALCERASAPGVVAWRTLQRESARGGGNEVPIALQRRDVRVQRALAGLTRGNVELIRPITLAEAALDACHDLVHVPVHVRGGGTDEVHQPEQLPRAGIVDDAVRTGACAALEQRPQRRGNRPIIKRNRRRPDRDRRCVAAPSRRDLDVAVVGLSERGQVVVDVACRTTEQRPPIERRARLTHVRDLPQVAVRLEAHAGVAVAGCGITGRRVEARVVAARAGQHERRAVAVEEDLGIIRDLELARTRRASGEGRRTRAGKVAGRVLENLVDGGLRRRAARPEGLVGRVRRVGRRLEEAAGIAAPVEPAVPEEVAVPELNFAAVVPLDAEHDVAVAVAGVHAEQGREARFPPVAFRRRHGLGVHFDAFEVILQDEVHDAGHGVGAVHGRSAARDRLDALDGGRGDRVGVDNQRGVRRLCAAPVDEHERAVRADTAQVQAADAERGRRARLQALVELRAFGHELRHLIEDAFDAQRARVLEPLAVDRHDGTCGFEIAPDDARTGYGDFFEAGFLRLRGASTCQ